MNPAIAVIAAVLVVLAIRWLWRQSPAARGRTISRVLLVVGVLAVLLALSRIHPLIAIASGALILFNRLFAAKRLFDQFNGASARSGGASSKISTRILDMSLDHDSGDMDGTVREGRFTGSRLSQLSVDELLELLAQCRTDDPQSATVLEAYLDRVHAQSWRERAGQGADGGPRDAHPDASMSVGEAREILGVSESAGDDEIVAAHRKLMQKIHPDRGGSTYLAAKVNQAKELLTKS